jgi:type IV pilus assembly protein PilB
LPDTEHRYRVLLVDDEEDIRKTVSRRIDAIGYEVETAVDGRDALAKVDSFRPDLILLDVMMPGLDGYDVCARLQERRQTASIPVIFATALGEEQDKAAAFALGAVDYLSKPIDPAQLKAKLHAHLRTVQRWKELDKTTSSRGNKKALPEFPQFKTFLCDQFNLGQEARTRVSQLTWEEVYALPPGLDIAAGDMAKSIAAFLKTRYLPSIRPGDVQLGTFPTSFCKSNEVAVLSDGTADPLIVLANPFNWQLMDAMPSDIDLTTRLAITEPENIRNLFGRKLPGEHGLLGIAELRTQGPEENVHVLEASAKQGPVVTLANHVISKAIQAGASDVHLQPMEHALGVRYRIDGMLHDDAPIAKTMQAALLSRIKIMANLDIAERRVPQDGRIRIHDENRTIDLRVSTLPAQYGEKIVLRILDKSGLRIEIDQLGFEESALTRFRESIHKPNGMILATGPTGSGKTTTLYAALQELNRPHVNILTVEDPIEYEIDRVTQVQVHPEAGRTFPVVLRSFLRQDPDVIMVGELRDRETLDIAFKASLTGHMVLSTLHTNDAPSTVTRLVDMGMEPYLVGSSLELILAQRLLRKLCLRCRKPAEAPESVTRRFQRAIGKDARFYEAGACERCHKTGYRGRIPATEVMWITAGVRKLIAERANAETLRTHAIEQCDMRTLQEDGIAKASRGLTSLEEVFRITG